LEKLTKEYFSDGEVLILGYPLMEDKSMNMIVSAFQKNNITVYAMNAKATKDLDIKIYKSFEELPKIPKCTYIYLAKEDITPWIAPMKENGVERVLFHAKRYVGTEDIEACKKEGLETALACPMMLLGGGIHKFHKMVAGV
jgi:hypothetical protein